MNNNNNQIDLNELMNVLFGYKRFILVITVIFSLISVIYSLSLPNKYTSSASLMVSDSSSASDGISSMASQYGGLASLAGIAVPTSDTKEKLIFAEETIKSRDFMKILLETNGVLENIIAASDYDFGSQEIIYDSELYDSVKKEWVYIPAPGQKIPPSYLQAHKKFVEEIVRVEIDDETNFMTVEVEHVSPRYAYDLLNLVIEKLNNTTRQKDLDDSKRALNYLEDQLSLIQQADIRKSINRLIESQLETLMLTNVRDEYLIKPLDKAFVPELKSSPRRSIICIIGAFRAYHFNNNSYF